MLDRPSPAPPSTTSSVSRAAPPARTGTILTRTCTPPTRWPWRSARSSYAAAAILLAARSPRKAADSLRQPLRRRRAGRFPDPRSITAEIDLENGREGNVLFVNGQVRPRSRSRAARSALAHRERLGGARLGLALPGRPLIKVGTDGGAVRASRQVSDVVLANRAAEWRMVRGDSSDRAAGSAVRSLHARRARPTGTAPAHCCMSALAAWPAHPPAVQCRFRQCGRSHDTDRRRHAARDRDVTGPAGRQADGHASQRHPRALNTTEIWTIQNVVGMDHPFHLHRFQARLVDRGGVPEPFPPAGTTPSTCRTPGALVVRVDDYPGALDVPLPHPGSRRRRNDGRSRTLQLKGAVKVGFMQCPRRRGRGRGIGGRTRGTTQRLPDDRRASAADTIARGRISSSSRTTAAAATAAVPTRPRGRLAGEQTRGHAVPIGPCSLTPGARPLLPHPSARPHARDEPGWAASPGADLQRAAYGPAGHAGRGDHPRHRAPETAASPALPRGAVLPWMAWHHAG